MRNANLLVAQIGHVFYDYPLIPHGLLYLPLQTLKWCPSF
jgi:hypothetical protein